MNMSEVKELPQLPVEVWVKILKNVPNPRELSLVSKTFYEAVKLITINKTFVSINCSDVKSSVEYIEEKVGNKSELNIQLISPNYCILDFLKNHGNRIKILKIDGKCKLKDYLDILSLVPNCDSLDIASIKFIKENSHQCADSAMMVKLNDLHIDICNDLNDIFWKNLNTPALKKLKIDFTTDNIHKLDEILDKNHQLKILELNGRKIETKKNNSEGINQKFELKSLKCITLDSIILKGLFWFKNDSELLTTILKVQPDLKNFQAFHLENQEIDAISNYALKFESLEIKSLNASYETLSKLTKLTNLKKLSLEKYEDKNDPSEFFIKLAQNVKHLQHLELNREFFKDNLSVSFVLENFTNLETLKLHDIFCFDSILFDSNLFSNFYNANLKLLHYCGEIPLKLFEKFILNFPNLEILELKTFNAKDNCVKSDNTQKMLNLINSAKESTEDIQKVREELIETVLKDLNIYKFNDLLRLQLTLIQLGWPKLRELKVNSRKHYSDIEDQIEDLFNAKKDLQLFEIHGFNNSYNEKEYSERFQKKFDKITYDKGIILSFGKVNERDLKSSMKAIKIKNYSKYETILNTRRIKSFKINFGFEAMKNEETFEYFAKLIENHQESILELEVNGLLNKDQFTHLVSLISNCEIFNITTSYKMSQKMSLNNLKTLQIHQCKDSEMLRMLKVPKLHKLKIRIVDFTVQEALKEFLNNQKTLKILKIPISSYRNDNFLILCKLDELKLYYSAYSDDSDEIDDEKDGKITNILTNQTDLKSLELDFMTKTILNVITKDLRELRKLKIDRMVGSFDDCDGICQNVEFLEFKFYKHKILKLAEIFPNVKILTWHDSFLLFSEFFEVIEHFKHLTSLIIKAIEYYRNCIWSYLVEKQRNSLRCANNDEPNSFVNTNLVELTYDCKFRNTHLNILLEHLPNLQKLALNSFDLKVSALYEGWVKLDLEIILKNSNIIEYVYYKIDRILKIDPNVIKLIEEKENLKFLCLEGIKIENFENFSTNLQSSFDIIEVDQQYPRILLAKNIQTLQEVFDTSWNEAKIKSNNQIRQILGLKKVREEKICDSDDSSSDSEVEISHSNRRFTVNYDSCDSSSATSDSDTE